MEELGRDPTGEMAAIADKERGCGKFVDNVPLEEQRTDRFG